MTSQIVLSGARVVAGGRVLDPGYVVVEGETIAAVGAGNPPPGAEGALDLAGRWLLPGYIDIHVHGGGGGGFTGPDRDEHLAATRFHGRHGTTSLLATSVTSAPDHLVKTVAALRETMRGPTDGARIAGINMEGPYLSVVRRGAHDPAIVRDPDLAEFAHLVEAAEGALRVMTVAPERPGADELIAALRAVGAIASIGHSATPYDVALAAVDRGASLVTHTFNGMDPLHHRRPGLVAAALNSPELTCELIADGLHVDGAVVRTLVGAKGVDRVVLVTDCIHAAGLPAGDYDMGEGHVITVVDGLAKVKDTDTIAGSTLTMERAVKNVVRFAGVSVVEASRMASENQARMLGLPGLTGRIVTGGLADVVVLDDELTVEATMVGGSWSYRADDLSR